MKRILILTFCVTILFSTICLAAKSTNHSKSQPTSHSFLGIFRPIGNLFKKILGKEPKTTYCPPSASIQSLNLNQTEYIIGKSEPIQVQVSALNSDIDVVTYKYQVSGGKIVGHSDKVIWDLSDVKAGNYTITAGIDGGRGVAKEITKTITIKECPNCK